MELVAWAYLGVFVASAALTLGLTPLALRIAVRRGVVDVPGGHKSHTSPVPYLGGLAIVVAFAVAMLAAALIGPIGGGIPQLAAILGLATGLAVLGLVDDLKGVPVPLRFGVELAAALALWWSGTAVALTGITAVDAGLTVLWVVGITNAFNLLDNMDGLSAGVAAIAAVFFLLLAALNGQYLVASLAAALAGCALGFLRHNFHPARIYMGDAGALFIGFLLAAIAIRLRFEGQPQAVTFAVPILVLGVALFDTALVSVTRVGHRRSPFTGGRDHTSHRLVFVGIPVHAAVSLIYAAALALGWLAVVMSRLDDLVTGWLLLGFVLACGLFAGVLLGLVPVYDNSQRRRVMIQEVAEHEPEPVT